VRTEVRSGRISLACSTFHLVLDDTPGGLRNQGINLAQEPPVLTEGGHAIAALFPIDDDDLESLALSLSPKFQALIERARAEYRNGASLPTDDVRRELGIP